MDAAYTEAERDYEETIASIATTPKTRTATMMYESPDVGSPFTEDSWRLLERIEMAATQQPIEETRSDELDAVDFDSFDDGDLARLERQAMEKIQGAAK